MWGICRILQNVSVESRAIPRIKLIVSLGKINEESIKWINQNSNTSVQVRFYYQMKNGTNLGKEGEKTPTT